MYDQNNIDKKWQKRWEEEGVFHAKDDSEKPKYYCLIEFPYPSGDGLHMGHPRSYTALDTIARKRRMEGYNVLYPIGWDAFGLPTENYAIKHKMKPQEVTKKNTDTFRRQLQSLGISFDWSREVNTTDPEYYKWTQWMFLEFFKAGLAYKDKIAINWCLSCKIGLANEEVVNGECERCHGPVEKRDKEQWMIAITKYADRLLSDLDTVDYMPKIKKQQQDWIGKSEGAEIEFEVAGTSDKGQETSIKVFTTRPDTLFGATYMVLSPEHELVKKITTPDQRSEVENYVEEAKKKSDIERGDATKEKTGVFTGAYAINPANDKKILIWVADYVMMGYGTGAIMAVPAHDERDFEFAKKFDLPIREVVKPGALLRTLPVSTLDAYSGQAGEVRVESECFAGYGEAVNSDFLDGLSTSEAKEKMITWLEEKGIGKRAVNFKLRDWVFSRQRYWGEPIPLVFCENCKQVEARNPKSEILNAGWVPVPIKDLPVTLPDVEKYEPTDTGESPLAAITDWVNTTCPACGGPAKRETDTMPNWAGSSWYFLAYAMFNNLASQPGLQATSYHLLTKWLPVDLYDGGMEHTTLHLLYSRFWNKFLFDRGFAPTNEPYARRHSHGLILAEDGRKMSKSLGNVINPDEIIGEFGADSLRVYEMFIGPFEEPVPWSTNGLIGIRRFLDRVRKLVPMANIDEPESVTKELHKTIKKVTEDIDDFRFNTAVAQMMIFVNAVYSAGSISENSLLRFAELLCPFAPHVANELAFQLGGQDLLETHSWPKYDESLTIDDVVTIAVQVNGKLRATIEAPLQISQADAVELAMKQENVAKFVEREPKKVIFVKGKLINFVV